MLLSEQVINVLLDWGSAKGPKKAMLSFLRESVPLGGPQENNEKVCIIFKPRSLGLAEFRKGEHRGTKVRVIWFYSDEACREIVCVRAFTKNDAATPPSEIPAAKLARQEFFDAKAGRNNKQLNIEDLPPETPKNDSRRKARKGHRARRARP